MTHGEPGAKGPDVDAVTGAFGYTGRYITSRLLARGGTVRTLTSRPQSESPFGDRVEAFPFSFDRPAELVDSLRGATTLYNTYWVRFPHRGMTFERAVSNSEALIRAAREAGVRRLVHISITSASEDSPLPYFRGKGLVEQAVVQSGLSYAIIRPTVVFGAEDILINNIAWFLRRFPLFPIPGSGEYPVQPVYVEDVAELAVRCGHEDANLVLDAVGPETYPYRDMVRLIAEKVGSRARTVRVSPGLAFLLARLMGYALRDVVLTREEVAGLMRGLLVSGGPPTGPTHLSRWLEENHGRVGTGYASELARRQRR